MNRVNKKKRSQSHVQGQKQMDNFIINKILKQVEKRKVKYKSNKITGKNHQGGTWCCVQC